MRPTSVILGHKHVRITGSASAHHYRSPRTHAAHKLPSHYNIISTVHRHAADNVIVASSIGPNPLQRPASAILGHVKVIPTLRTFSRPPNRRSPVVNPHHYLVALTIDSYPTALRTAS